MSLRRGMKREQNDQSNGYGSFSAKETKINFLAKIDEHTEVIILAMDGTIKLLWHTHNGKNTIAQKILTGNLKV